MQRKRSSPVVPDGKDDGDVPERPAKRRKRTPGDDVYARLDDCVLFKNLVLALKEVVTNVNLEVTPRGMFMEALDAANICIVKMHMEAACFDEFYCRDREMLGLDLACLHTVLNCARSGSALELRYSRSREDVFVVSLSSEEESRVYQLNLLDIDADEVGAGELDHALRFCMESAQLRRMVRDMSKFGADILKIGAREDDVVVFTARGSLGKCVSSVPVNDTVRMILERPTAASYALSYLDKFCRASGLSRMVGIGIDDKSNMLSVEFPFRAVDEDGDGEHIGYIQYTLAARNMDDVEELWEENSCGGEDEEEEE